MQDRVPVNPGRVLIKPENGSASYYATMTRADNPTQEGTPLNKVSLLKDATAALFGLTANAVPDDVLAFLGEYNKYYWKRRTYSTKYEEVQSTYNDNIFFVSQQKRPNKVNYSTQVSFSEDGTPVLVNPTTVTINQGTSNDGLTVTKATFPGKYVQNVFHGYQTSEVDTGIYYISPTATFTWTGGCPYVENPSTNVKKISSKLTITRGEWSIVKSASRSAYVDFGVSGGYEYVYLGVPFENIVNAVKIETGSYVGSGTYGASNPNVLNLNLEPKIIFLHSGTVGASNNVPMYYILYTGAASFPGVNGGAYNYLTWAGNTVSWYCDQSNASYQFNNSGSTYHYIAIG